MPDRNVDFDRLGSASGMRQKRAAMFTPKRSFDSCLGGLPQCYTLSSKVEQKEKLMAKGADKQKEGKGKKKLTTKEKQDKKKEKAKK